MSNVQAALEILRSEERVLIVEAESLALEVACLEKRLEEARNIQRRGKEHMVRLAQAMELLAREVEPATGSG